MKIHQIYITDNNNSPSEYVSNKMQNLKELYSDYEYILWDKHSIEKFISENFDEEVLTAYNCIKPYAFKADLARYCILYKLGGYYFDVSICPEFKFEPKEPIVFNGIVNELETNNLNIIENNVLFFSEPNNEFLKEAIDKSVKNILDLNPGKHPLDITGPIMLGRLKSKINYGQVEQRDGYKVSLYNNELIYPHKPREYQANLSKLGCAGTNNYEKMWFNGNLFNVTYSYVMITNGKKHDITKMSILSILDNMKKKDELIIVGDVEFLNCFKEHGNIVLYHDMDLASGGKVSKSRNVGNHLAKGQVIINTDDDMIFPLKFREKLDLYIRSNYKSFDTLNVVTLLPNGSRWWDRSIYRTKGDAIMVPYNSSYDDRLFYPAAILIWKKCIAESIPFDETHLYYDPVKDNEDVKLSNDLKMHGYIIKIDTNNSVIHYDDSYITFIDERGQMVGDKKIKHPNKTDIICDPKLEKNISEILQTYKDKLNEI